MEYAWKKKLFALKFVEDVRRVWEYYLMYADAIWG